MMQVKWKDRLAARLVAPIGIALAVLSAPSVSFAAPGGLGRDLGGTVTRMMEGNRVMAPFASVVFCMQNSGQCRDTGGPAVVTLDAGRRAQLISVNASVNRSIRPVNDPAGTDVWSVDVDEGDCEDYALTKRKHLLDLGWPSSALRIAVARTAAGEGHAVLVAKTSAGDYVLDNRTSKIKDWRSTDLRWIMIQSQNSPRKWVSLENRRQEPMMVSDRDEAPRSYRDETPSSDRYEVPATAKVIAPQPDPTIIISYR